MLHATSKAGDDRNRATERGPHGSGRQIADRCVQADATAIAELRWHNFVWPSRWL
jgi:hypothetical protein